VLLDLGAEGMTQERACAVAVRLLDLGYFRIGNEEYAEENNSFGLTTLERRHVRREGKALVFEFAGKSGIEHTVTIDDPSVVEALEVMRRRRGGDDSLLAWKDGRRWRSVDSSLVNQYVGRTTGMEATAKDFRTWHATVIAASSLAATGVASTKTARKRAVVAAMKEVSEYLGNTPALARSSYVDPRVVDAYEEGRTIEAATKRRYKTADAKQAALERAVLRLLKG
jgi:DNA topoisomerase IB